MEKALVETSGFAPAGLVERLRTVRWRHINDGEGGKLFPGISIFGRHPVRDGGSENAPFSFVITDESTKAQFGFRARTFTNVLQDLQRIRGGILIYLRKHPVPLKSRSQPGFVKYTITIFP